MLNKEIFKNPTVEYRGCTFWSLNDRLSKDEICRQLEEFRGGGFGGVFMHSRSGLITEYLSDEWFDMLGHAVEKCAELGLKAWIYDEDKWPSGFAGGLIPRKSESYRVKILTRIPKGAGLPERSRVVSSDNEFNYLTMTSGMGFEQFNGTTYGDLMNSEVVEYFIECTYEKYKAHFSQYFGDVIPGVFTDEPTFRANAQCFPQGLNYFPYSPEASRRYAEKYGEEPEKHARELFAPGEEGKKYRYRYMRTLSEQFTENYTKRLAEWCEQNNLLLTGHYMYEDSIESQSTWDGSVMEHFEHMHIPGVDHLKLDIENPLTPKQCSAVANQQGKKVVMSEMFGGAGQGMTFEDRMWIGGWHAIMGVNFVCHHLSHYSLRGSRKYDYPLTLSPHQPYWHENSFVEDFQSRLAYLTRLGKFSADFMVIHPGESGWCLQSGNGTRPEMQRLDSVFAGFIDEMFAIHRDFDFVNESFLERHGSIDGTTVKAGKMSYRAIIVPCMTTMRKSTLEFLEHYQKQGGFIALLLPAPRISAESGEEIGERVLKLASCIAHDSSELDELLAKGLPAELTITGKNSQHVFMHRRKLDDAELVLLFNSSRRECAKVKISLGDSSESFKIKELDLTSGNSLIGNDSVTLHPAQTKAFLLTKARQRHKAPKLVVDSSESGFTEIEKTNPAITDTVELTGEWEIIRTAANTAVLDFAEWSTDGKNWSEPLPLVGIREELQNLNYFGPLHLRFTITSEVTERLTMFCEPLPNGAEIFINGNKAKFIPGEFQRMQMFAVDCNELFINGSNIIEISLPYRQGDRRCFEDSEMRYGTEIDTVFLCGDFAVVGEFAEESTNLPNHLFDDIWNMKLPERRLTRIGGPLTLKKESGYSPDGELTTCGYPFCAGSITLKKNFTLDSTSEKVRLSLPFLDGVCARARINGREIPGLICSTPYELDLSGMTAKGNNALEITLTNSLRNLLGPNHLSIGEARIINMGSFSNRDYHGYRVPKRRDWAKKENRDKLLSWTDHYHVRKFGLAGGVKIISEKPVDKTKPVQMAVLNKCSV